MCNRRCPLNLIVRASFEWREMDNLLRSFGVILDVDAASPTTPGEVFRATVDRAHDDLAFSKRLTRMLCTVHSRAIDTTRSESLDTLSARVEAPIDPSRDVPALWALVVDRRPETSRLAWRWLQTSPLHQDIANPPS